MSTDASPLSAAPAGALDALLVPELPDPGELSVEGLAFARDAGLTFTAADLLFRAGFAPGARLDRFLRPRLEHLTQPDGMADRDAAAERIARAVRAGERIAIFGDYDCDGVTATAILTLALRALGGDVTPLLATRREGAYGLSDAALARVLAARPSLLITCDCGSADHERVATAAKHGVDTVVIDHHLVPTEPLPALAFLNPHRPECGFPYKGLASCGLALSVAAAVRKALGRALDVRPLLDLVAIGTIADVAPLTADNRSLVRAGLGVLASSPRPGLRAMAELAKIDLAAGLSAEDVAFRIAPRLNAPGRLGDPDDALALLLASDAPHAQALAARVEHITQERRLLTEAMVREAHTEIAERDYLRAPALVLARATWHPGVVGIVAGRLASTFGRPTIVVGLEGEVGRGSVRGPRGARLYDALTACSHELVKFGGHQAAAGVAVRADRVEALREAWTAAWSSLEPQPEVVQGTLVRLDPRDDPEAVGADLDRVEPCGEGNPAPVVMLRAAHVRSARSLKGHLRLDLDYGGHRIPGFVFGQGELAERLQGRLCDVAGKLRPDRYRGGTAVELSLRRLAFSVRA